MRASAQVAGPARSGWFHRICVRCSSGGLAARTTARHRATGGRRRNAGIHRRHGTPSRGISAGHAGRDNRAVAPRRSSASRSIGTTDLDKIAPNLQFHSYGTLTGNNSAAQVFIRGIGQTDATPAVDPGVGIYIDDVYMGRSVGGAMDFRDISNVQILRGPQGTLFGRNTIGGAVLLTTNAPGDNAGNSVRVGVGEDNLHEVYGAFDMPLGDTWSARIAVGGRERDGYVTRVFDGKDLGDEKMYTGQLGIRWKPSDAFSLTLRGDYTNEDENGSPFVFQSMNEAATFVGAASQAAGCPNMLDPLPPPVLVGPLADPRCGNDAQALGPFKNGGTYPASSTLENSGVSLVAQWDVNDTLSFKSITADRSLKLDRHARRRQHAAAHPAHQLRQQERPVQRGTAGGRDSRRAWMAWSASIYFDEDSFDRLLVPLGNPGTSYDTQRVSMDAKAKAAFTEWTFKFTDAFSCQRRRALHRGDQGPAGHHVQRGARDARRSRRRPRLCVRSPARRRRRPAACS